MALLALAALTAAPAPAAVPAAPTSASFALTAVGKSGALRLRGTAGRTVRGSVLVRNVSARRITVRLQPADIRNATNGNADYVTTRRSAAGRWVKLAAATVRLGPMRSRRIGFSVRVPAGIRGVSRYAGIVALDAAELAAAARDRKRRSETFKISRINRQALPITIRLPGPLTRKLTLRSVKLDVQPAGAGLVLVLRPSGTVLIQSAPMKLRVSRGTRTILMHRSTLGQLFPDDTFSFRIPWRGRRTAGDYRVRGVIRPKGAPAVYIDRTLTFTPSKVEELKAETPPVAAAPPAPGLPSWVWLVLTGAGGLLAALALACWRFARRARRLPGTA